MAVAITGAASSGDNGCRPRFCGEGGKHGLVGLAGHVAERRRAIAVVAVAAVVAGATAQAPSGSSESNRPVCRRGGFAPCRLLNAAVLSGSAALRIGATAGAASRIHAVHTACIRCQRSILQARTRIGRSRHALYLMCSLLRWDRSWLRSLRPCMRRGTTSRAPTEASAAAAGAAG